MLLRLEAIAFSFLVFLFYGAQPEKGCTMSTAVLSSISKSRPQTETIISSLCHSSRLF